MPLLRHECLVFGGSSNDVSFALATVEGRRSLETIDGRCRVLYVEYASTWQEAMQRHYDRQGWGRYQPVPDMIDRPYGPEELERQLADFPDDADLRRLNGLKH